MFRAAFFNNTVSPSEVSSQVESHSTQTALVYAFLFIYNSQSLGQTGQNLGFGTAALHSGVSPRFQDVW